MASSSRLCASSDPGVGLRSSMAYSRLPECSGLFDLPYGRMGWGLLDDVLTLGFLVRPMLFDSVCTSSASAPRTGGTELCRVSTSPAGTPAESHGTNLPVLNGLLVCERLLPALVSDKPPRESSGLGMATSSCGIRFIMPSPWSLRAWSSGEADDAEDVNDSARESACDS